MIKALHQFVTKRQEENMDQERNRRKMPPWGSRGMPGMVYWHPFQAPGSHQHEQIWSRLGQRFLTQNTPQGSQAYLQQAVKIARNAQPIHQANLGQMAETQSGLKIPFTIQFAYLLCAQETRNRDSGLFRTSVQINLHSHTYKYSMREINECIGNIWCDNSSIFLMLDLTSGIWQM